MNATLYRTDQELAPSTIVVSYYPLIGNEQNTAARYEEEARFTGCNYLGITRPGSDMTTFSRQLRHQLAPENFDDFMAEQAKDLPEQVADYDNVIIRGQSAGSFPGLSLIKTDTIEPTHLVVEDGINLRTSLFGGNRNPVQAKLDWAVNKIQEAKADTQPLNPNWFIPEKSSDKDVIKKFIVEVRHWSRLWQSNYSKQSVLEIIESKPKLPVLLAFLGHSATASSKDLYDYWRLIATANNIRNAFDPKAAPVRCFRNLDAWHNILEYPQYSAANITQVLNLS